MKRLVAWTLMLLIHSWASSTASARDPAHDPRLPAPSPRWSEPVMDPLTMDYSFGISPSYGPANRFLRETQPDLVEQLHERTLELQPDGNARSAMERVRGIYESSVIGVDTTAEEWREVDNNGLTLEWGGRIHMDWINWINDDEFGVAGGMNGQPNSIGFRRLRLVARGEGYGVYFYQLETEFVTETLDVDLDDGGMAATGADIGVDVKDAYLGIRDYPLLGTIKAGHQFVPIGLERLTSSNYNTFMERGLPNTFLPGRELGVAVNNYSANQRMTWAFGVFADDLNETSKTIITDNQGTRLAGRLTATPIYDELSEGRFLLHVGGGYQYARPRSRLDPFNPLIETRPVAFGARPEIHIGNDLVFTDRLDAKHFHVANAELAWVHGPWSLQGEVIWSGVDTTVDDSIDLYGAYAYVSYFLTGEHRVYDRLEGTFGRVIPYENSWLVPTPRGTAGGWGAWEVAARWSYLDFTELRGQRLTDITVGLNVYLNPHSRLMLNWIHPIAENSPVGLEATSEGDIMAMRMQVDY